jgi:hypothetical protein
MIATRILATAFGLLMVAAVALQADAIALVAAAVGAVAVLCSIRFPTAATLAVCACIAAIALSDASPMLTAVAGLSATCYLIVRHAGVSVPLTRPTVIGTLGLSALGLVATAVPMELPWVTLAAPLAVFALFVLAVRPLSRFG